MNFTGRNGLNYRICTEIPRHRRHILKIVASVEGTGEFAGQYLAKEGNTPQLVRLFDLDGFQTGDRIIMSGINIAEAHKGEGLGSELLKNLVQRLQEGGEPHLAGFTADGLRVLRKKFIELGYRSIAPVNCLPENLSQLRGWVYKDHRNP